MMRRVGFGNGDAIEWARTRGEAGIIRLKERELSYVHPEKVSDQHAANRKKGHRTQRTGGGTCCGESHEGCESHEGGESSEGREGSQGRQSCESGKGKKVRDGKTKRTILDSRQIQGYGISRRTGCQGRPVLCFTIAFEQTSERSRARQNPRGSGAAHRSVLSR